MKSTRRTLLYFCFLFVTILACTKDVGLVTEVEFTLSETHTSDGFVNQPIGTTLTVTPEEILEGYEYFFSYSLNDAEGYFQDANGEQLPTGELIPLNPYSATLSYVGTATGDHIINIKAEDTFGYKQEVSLQYTISEVPATWTATATVSQVMIGQNVPITVTLENGANGADVTYERNYQITTGSGELSTATNETIALNTFVAIAPGTYNLIFVPDALGSVVLTFDLKDSNNQELTAAISIEVVEEIISVTEIVVTPETLTLGIDDTGILMATVLPEDAMNSGITWISDNEAIAIVDANGLVTPVALGTVNIKAVSNENNNIGDSSIVTITDGSVAVTGIMVTPENTGIVQGETTQLIATISPENASNQMVLWTSEDETIATVDNNGLVTAIGLDQIIP